MGQNDWLWKRMVSLSARIATVGIFYFFLVNVLCLAAILIGARSLRRNGPGWRGLLLTIAGVVILAVYYWDIAINTPSMIPSTG